MKNLPISMKFLAILAMLGLFIIGALCFVGQQMYAMGNRAQAVNDTVVLAATDLSDAAGATEKIRSALEFMLLSGSPRAISGAGDAMTVSQHHIDDELTAAARAVPSRQGLLLDLRRKTDALLATDECKNIESKALQSVQAGGGGANQLLIQNFQVGCAPGFVPVTHNMEAQRNSLNALAERDLAALKRQTGHTIFITSLGILIGFVLVAFIGYFGMGQWVAKPFEALRVTMERLAQGEFNITLDTQRRDEVGAMARSVQVFRNAAEDKQRLEAAAVAAEQQAEREREHGARSREAAAAAQAVVVEGIADGLERLSSGDLLYRITVCFAPEYEKLRTDFNQAMETMERTMQGIAANTQGVRSGAAEITKSSDDLSRRTEQQAANLEETAAALDEINVTVSKTARGANAARDVVNTAKEDAERSGGVVREAVTAMQEIELSSKQISNIIGVIDEIAFQTNLLALNAGVEAARAGDAGRGFAVVATEVRALAQRSADAAKEIKALISSSGAQVDAGVRLVGETGKALARIVEQVAKLSDLVGEIAGSAQEQAVGLGQVNGAINQMDQVTQQNAAMVEEATAASHALSAEAEALARLVAQFSLGESDGEDSNRTTRPEPSMAPAGKFVTLPATMVGAGVGAGAGDWDEF